MLQWQHNLLASQGRCSGLCSPKQSEHPVCSPSATCSGFKLLFQSLTLEVVCLNMGDWRPEAFLQLIQDIVPRRADAQSPSWNLVSGMGVWMLNCPQGLGLIWSALLSSKKPTCTSPKQFVLVPKGPYVKQSPYTCCCMLAEMEQVWGEMQEGKLFLSLICSRRACAMLYHVAEMWQLMELWSPGLPLQAVSAYLGFEETSES